uniref:Uncharacterized protein n=1 Tax=Anopheles atroparvus TaxID=41427 RepID=A0AAG5CS92_ANOAO
MAVPVESLLSVHEWSGGWLVDFFHCPPIFSFFHSSIGSVPLSRRFIRQRRKQTNVRAKKTRE